MANSRSSGRGSDNYPDREQLYAMQSVFDNEAFYNAFDQGHFEYACEKTGYKNDELNRLIADFLSSAERLRNKLKSLGLSPSS